MNWLTSFTKYFPLVLAGVIHIQQALPTAPGATKKTILLDAIKAGSEVGEAVPESHVAGISTLIDTVVESLNKTNLAGFGSTKAVVASAPEPAAAQ